MLGHATHDPIGLSYLRCTVFCVRVAWRALKSLKRGRRRRHQDSRVCRMSPSSKLIVNTNEDPVASWRIRNKQRQIHQPPLCNAFILIEACSMDYLVQSLAWLLVVGCGSRSGSAICKKGFCPSLTSTIKSTGRKSCSQSSTCIFRMWKLLWKIRKALQFGYRGRQTLCSTSTASWCWNCTTIEHPSLILVPKSTCILLICIRNSPDTASIDWNYMNSRQTYDNILLSIAL